MDEYGCRIDQSQFEKEANRGFNRKIGPGFWGFIGMAIGPALARRSTRREVHATIV